MKAQVGDELVVKGRHVGDPDRTGVIIEVHGDAGGPPYLVRWSDGHESSFYPTTGTVAEHISPCPPASGHGRHKREHSAEAFAGGGDAAVEIVTESQYRFVIPQHGRMRVPGVVFATRALIPDPASDRALEQVVNVAELPGIVEASYAMPDVHWGYGFPIGGVAATDAARGGVVSPGGVGFDIACGVRLLAADLSRAELLPALGRVMDRLAAVIPCGAGRGGLWALRGRAELEKLLAGGAGYAVACGHGGQRDLDRCEDRGVAEGADPGQVSSRVADRGRHQVGSLGSGNHFLEVQAVQEVFDPAAARAFGLAEASRHDPLRLPRAGPSGLHRSGADHGQDDGPLRHHCARPAAACAPVTSPEGRLPGRHGRRRELRAGQPPAARRGGQPRPVDDRWRAAAPDL